ncbi:MAG TPA: PKD domain-containing protein, partial [Thermoplasmatales archaeon]|nr:PKD domain-containing protein [Thermoplasmatales archaeon]
GETAVFEPLGFTQLNLTVDIETNNGEGSNEGESPIPPPDGNNNEVQEPIPPVACIGGPYIGFVNKTVIFNASQSYDLDGVIVSYSWNFGDNTTGSGVTPSHTYVSKGIYVITLKVTDDSGLFDTNETTITIMFDSDGDGWGDREEEQYGTNASDPMDYPLDTDHDRLPDTVDNDDDNDGLPDEIEEQLGSNETNPADVIKIKINNITYYLVDIDSDDMSDIFYDIANEIITQVNVTERGTYLIDVDGDGSWDYEYNSADGNVLFIKKGENKNNLLLLLGVVLALVVIIAVILLLIVKKVLKKKGGKGGK